MRNSELKKLFKAEADSIRPDFNAILERINAEPVERERVVNTAEAIGNSTASPKKRSKRAAWRNSGNTRVVSKSRLAIGAASFCCALMLTVASVFSIGYFSKINNPSLITVGADTYVSLNINPGVDFTVNKYNKITSVVATNSGGVLLITKLCDVLGVESLVGRELNDALVNVIDTATKMGYIDVDAVGISNALMISVIAENDVSAGAIKNDLAVESKKYFADNGIYAVVVTEYDNKKALVEEARKSNPELTEDSSVGDLISSIEKNNADKSALQAEIESARQNYEAYLKKTFSESKDKVVNKEISIANNDIVRLEKLISSLRDMLDEKTNGIAKDETANTSDDTSAVIDAIVAEIEAKTQAYNKRVNELNAEKNNANAAISEAKGNIDRLVAEINSGKQSIAELEQKIIELTSNNALNADNLQSLNSNLTDIKNAISGTNQVTDFLTRQENWLYSFDNGSVGYEKHIEIVETIIKNAGFYDIMLDASLDDSTRHTALIEVAKKTSVELFGAVDLAMINEIISEFKRLGGASFNSLLAVGTNAIKELCELDSTSSINKFYALSAKEQLTNSENALKIEISNLQSVIAGIDNEISDLSVNIESLNAKIIDLAVNVSDTENEIKTLTETLDNIDNELNKSESEYKAVLNAQIDKANLQLSRANKQRDTLRQFREQFKQGDRLSGFDGMNAELAALEAKLASDIAKNDADALAESLEVDLKNQANELFNENINKFNEHDRQFTAEEYEAWEREQKELVKNLSWEEIYSAWLENQI